MRKVFVMVLWVLAISLGIYLMSTPASVIAQNVPAKKVRILRTAHIFSSGWIFEAEKCFG